MRMVALLFVGLGRGMVVGVENVLKGDDTLEFVNIGATDDGQHFQMFCAHAFECEWQRLIGVNMRESAGLHDVADEASGWTFSQGVLQRAGIEDTNDTAVIEDGPGKGSTLAIKFRGLLKGEMRGQGLLDGPHGLEDLALAFDGTRMRARQVNAILVGEDLVNRFLLEARRNEITDETGDHQWDDNGVVASGFKDHDDGGHGSTNDTGESRTHADEGISAGRGNVAGEKLICKRSDDATQHGAKKEAGAKDAARIAGSIAHGDGKKLENEKNNHELQGHAAIEHATDVLVTDAKHLGHEPAHDTDEKAASDGLVPNRVGRKLQEAFAPAREHLGKGH